jgi:hypothetical protein
MKNYGKTGLVLTALVLAFSLAAVAASDHGSTEISLSSPAKVGGTELAAGTYKVDWKVNGDNVEVSFSQNKKVIATAQAKLTQQTEKARYSALDISSDGSGARMITKLRLGGRNTVLVFA